MNITLIGMPGSGKSLIGRKLADRLGYTLVEVDKILEQHYNLPLPQIVDKLGNESFLDGEADAVIRETAGRDHLVVSPGGSIIYRERATEHLKKISQMVYLQVPLEILQERIGDIPRGIVMRGNKTLADLYAERIPLYEQLADYVLPGAADPETLVKGVLSVLGLDASAHSR